MRLKDKEPEKCRLCGRMEPLHHNGGCDACVDKLEEYGDLAREIRRNYEIAKGRRDPDETD